MPVDLVGIPAKGPPFFRQRIERHNLAAAAGCLPFIEIDHDAEIAYLLRRGQHGRLPDRALVAFTVAQ